MIYLLKAFQCFKMLMDSVDKLTTSMELTDEVLNTQFYYKVNDYKTLVYNLINCRSDEYVAKDKDQYEIFFGFETITSEYKHMPYL